MHNVVSHYLKCWYIFYGRPMLKRVRNVTGMSFCSGSGHIIPVLCYILYICAFISQCSVIIYIILWLPPAFCGIKLISELYYRFMMQNRYTGFCWFIATDSVILDYRNRGVKIPRIQFQYLIRCLFVRSRGCEMCPIALKFDRHLNSSVKNTQHKEI